jgi:hypothetical protein
LWTIFGDHCDYYKELLKIYRILDREECFTIRNTYTREICARITWAIVDEGRSFFGQNPVASDFAPGTMFNFSTCLLEGITDSVCNAIPIQQAMFPREWMAPMKAPDATFSRPPPPGPPPTWWEPAPALPPPLTGGPPPGRPGQEDIRHPKIKQLMDPYLKRYNNYVNVAEILTASGKRMTDLPSTLPQYCHPTGQSFLCWNSALGKCFRGPRCKFSRGHLKRVNPLTCLPMVSPTSSAKGSYTILTSRSGRAVVAPPKANAKAWGRAPPLREPDFGRVRVLSDAKQRQSTKKSHHNQVLREVINIRKISGRIGRRRWSEKRGVRLQDAWHSGRHRRTMNCNRRRGGQQIPRSGRWARRAMTKYPTH